MLSRTNKTHASSASNLDLSKYGLRQIQDGLIVGEARLDNGLSVYLAFERLENDEQLHYWKNYTATGGFYAQGGMFCRELAGYVEEHETKGTPIPTYPEGASAIFDSKADYDNAIKHITQQGYQKVIKSLKNLGGGQAGFWIKISDSIKKDYVVYASKSPITNFKYLSPTRNLKTTDRDRRHQEKFYLDYRDLIISVGSHTKVGSPSFTHMGITKNPCTFLEGDPYKNISFVLHGFAACVERQIFGASVMMNRPTEFMTEFFKKNLGESNMLFETFDRKSHKVFLDAVRAYCDARQIKCPADPSDFDHNDNSPLPRVMIGLDVLESYYVKANQALFLKQLGDTYAILFDSSAKISDLQRNTLGYEFFQVLSSNIGFLNPPPPTSTEDFIQKVSDILSKEPRLSKFKHSLIFMDLASLMPQGIINPKTFTHNPLDLITSTTEFVERYHDLIQTVASLKTTLANMMTQAIALANSQPNTQNSTKLDAGLMSMVESAMKTLSLSNNADYKIFKSKMHQESTSLATSSNSLATKPGSAAVVIPSSVVYQAKPVITQGSRAAPGPSQNTLASQPKTDATTKELSELEKAFAKRKAKNG